MRLLDYWMTPTGATEERTSTASGSSRPSSVVPPAAWKIPAHAIGYSQGGALRGPRDLVPHLAIGRPYVVEQFGREEGRKSSYAFFGGSRT
mmetsp:Transcript_24122/g.61452  ORF Transcript_24122/g.61452 Transcript_24122/m.61452 type:complete len:91 (-) Transcript_24122:811-1083(-)